MTFPLVLHVASRQVARQVRLSSRPGCADQAISAAGHATASSKNNKKQHPAYSRWNAITIWRSWLSNLSSRRCIRILGGTVLTVLDFLGIIIASGRSHSYEADSAVPPSHRTSHERSTLHPRLRQSAHTPLPNAGIPRHCRVIRAMATSPRSHLAR